MLDLTILLFERIGLQLVLVFMLTRIQSFRYLLDRSPNLKTIFFHAIIFGAFGVIGTLSGVLLREGKIVQHGLIYELASNEIMVGSGLVAIVIAGLMGGPLLGLASGTIAGAYTFFLGGETQWADSLMNPLAGMLAGFTARFFSQERVIAPPKAMFVGMFVPILHMGLLIIFTRTPEYTISLVDKIGLPLVITNSIAIAVFTAMIRVALNEQEQEAALATQRALRIAEESLPYLRQGLHFQTASRIATLLRNELKLAAVSITNKEQVLAHTGLGSDHHHQGDHLWSELSRVAIESGEIKVAFYHREIQCVHPHCPLQAAILVPLRQSGEVVGLVKMFFQRAEHVRAVDLALAKGLGKLMSNQLDIIAAEKVKSLVQEAQLRNLQAQINPHFLFNTLNLISSLIRVNPSQARRIVVELGQFMRLNLKSTSSSLIDFEQELEHLHAYIEIIKVRFSDRLTIDYDVDPGIGKVLIPPFTLQPLVENSIKHGLKEVSSGGMIKVGVLLKQGGIEIEVRDNGKGIPPEMIYRLGKQPVQSKDGNGVGLYNVNQRLIGLLGAASSLHIRNAPEKGCYIHFYIPFSIQEGSAGEDVYSSHDRRG